jgi:hypothetical protein
MSDLKLTSSLLSMLERIEQHSGTLLMLSVTASGGQDGKLNKLRGAGYVVKCDHPSVTEGAWPAEALAITSISFEGDRWFESGSLRQGVCLTGAFHGYRRKAPAFPGSVSLDETRERDLLAMSWLALVDFL